MKICRGLFVTLVSDRPLGAVEWKDEESHIPIILYIQPLVNGVGVSKLEELTAQYLRDQAPERPAYLKLKGALVDFINAGIWLPGESVPSENELASALSLSRMTVNRAVRELSQDGLLTRTRGVGTFVAERKRTSALLEVRNIADEITERGSSHTSRVQALGLLAPSDVPAWVSQELGADIGHSLIVHYDDGTPIQLEDRYVNLAAARNYLHQDFTRITPNAYLNSCAPITRGTHTVEAVLPTTQESALLGVSPAEPCLRLQRSTWSGDSLVSQVRLLHPGSSSRLEGSFTLH